jgi:predicted phage gp36 major capsid-like protein
VPQNAERDILRRMANASPIRAIATVRPVSTALFKKAYSTLGAAAGWSGIAPGPGASTPQQLADLNFPTFELFAQPAATQTLLDDASVDVERWIAEEAEIAFAEQEGAAFVTGDGVNQPQGLHGGAEGGQCLLGLGQPRHDLHRRGGGLPGHQCLGCAGRSDLCPEGRLSPERQLRDEPQDPERGAQAQGCRAAISGRRRRGGCAGHADELPVVEAEDMPDIAANASAIAFGDFRRGYLIVDRMGIRILRDPFSAKPYVLFYTTKRVGGGVQDFDAIKLLKFAA